MWYSVFDTLWNILTMQHQKLFFIVNASLLILVYDTIWFSNPANYCWKWPLPQKNSRQWFLFAKVSYRVTRNTKKSSLNFAKGGTHFCPFPIWAWNRDSQNLKSALTLLRKHLQSSTTCAKWSQWSIYVRRVKVPRLPDFQFRRYRPKTSTSPHSGSRDCVKIQISTLFRNFGQFYQVWCLTRVFSSRWIDSSHLICV